MIHAYDKLYLDKARTMLARMLDFAVYELHIKMEVFWDLFIASGVATRFESGDFTLLVGKSGVEAVYEVLDRSGLSRERIKPQYPADRSEEYWTGWALAYYQWETGLSFAEINKHIPITQVCALYSPYHEMDIRQFCDRMDQLYKSAKQDTNLKLLRKASGMSQRELAQQSGVPFRTIQQYEQRQKNINKAQAESLLRLSMALNCRTEDLLERLEE